MPRDVKSRPYDNSGRTEAARQTRRAIVAAARELFLELGYPATTLTAVAARAGVSVQTLYFHCGNKRTVLQLVVDHTVAGDDEPLPVREREWVQQILAEPDPYEKLRLHSRGVSRIMQRAEPIDRMLRSAAEVDPEAAAERAKGARQRQAGIRELAEHLSATGHLRPDLTPTEAAERLVILIDPEIFRLTTDVHGWTTAGYERWLHELLVASLLPGRTAAPAA